MKSKIDTVSDKQELNILSEPIRVIETPYHTIGSVCYYLKDSKALFSGDSLFKYSIEGILAYSVVPLFISSILGLVFFVISVIALFGIVIRAMIFGDPVSGWPSMVSIMLLLGSMILLCLGIVGLYISKIYLETKKRQIYIVKEKA
jgi:hypothetical protein